MHVHSSSDRSATGLVFVIKPRASLCPNDVSVLQLGSVSKRVLFCIDHVLTITDTFN